MSGAPDQAFGIGGPAEFVNTRFLPGEGETVLKNQTISLASQAELTRILVDMQGPVDGRRVYREPEPFSSSRSPTMRPTREERYQRRTKLVEAVRQGPLTRPVILSGS